MNIFRKTFQNFPIQTQFLIMMGIIQFTPLKKMLKEAEREQEKKMHKRTLCPASGLDRESQCKSIKECARGIP